MLAKARDVLRERGWYQGGFCKGDYAGYADGPVCLDGALRLAAGGSHPMTDRTFLLDRHAFDVARDRLADVCDGSVWSYNDVWARSIEDVLQRLKEAQYLLETGGEA